MSKKCFTHDDYSRLMDLLVPLCKALPQIQTHCDRLFFQLGPLMGDGFKYASFEEFRDDLAKTRGEGNVRVEKKLFRLVLLAYQSCWILKHIPHRFPETSQPVARLMWEILRAVEKQTEPFAQFHQEQKYLHIALNSKIKGVG